jgi:hypothetical protein
VLIASGRNDHHRSRADDDRLTIVNRQIKPAFENMMHLDALDRRKDERHIVRDFADCECLDIDGERRKQDIENGRGHYLSFAAIILLRPPAQ